MMRCGLTVRSDLKPRTAANDKQRGLLLFSPNCLSVDLSGAVRDRIIRTSWPPLVSFYCCRWLINAFILAVAPFAMVSSCDFNYLRVSTQRSKRHVFSVYSYSVLQKEHRPGPQW